MTNLLKLRVAIAGAAFLFAVTSAAPVYAEDPAARAADPALELGISNSASVHLTGDALYWADHKLSEVCATLGGSFAKLNASAIYECRLQDRSGQRFAAKN